MLKILKRIVQDVTTSQHLTEALQTLVQCVRSAIYAEAVSVYLMDAKRTEYVLIATDGLNKDAEFKFRISCSRGLIGLIGRREEPINIDNLSTHPDYHHSPLLNEDHL